MNKGIIILDGPDACGKTTLQNYIVENYGAIPMHLTWNKDLAPHMFEYQTDEMYKAIQLSQDNLVVVDRHWISELIYAKVFRNGSPWPLMGRMMDRVWRKHAAIYIMCTPSRNNFDLTIERHKANIDAAHPYPDDKFRELLETYHSFTMKFNKRKDVIVYDLAEDGKDLPFFCDKVICKQLQSWRSAQLPFALTTYPNILGHLSTAKYLIVDEPNTLPKLTTYSWPLYLYSSYQLAFNSLLNSLKVNETECMFANALNNGAFNTVIKDIVSRTNVRLIVLGDKAADILETNSIFYHTLLMHPQYITNTNRARMFKHQLQEALQ